MEGEGEGEGEGVEGRRWEVKRICDKGAQEVERGGKGQQSNSTVNHTFMHVCSVYTMYLELHRCVVAVGLRRSASSLCCPLHLQHKCRVCAGNPSNSAVSALAAVNE